MRNSYLFIFCLVALFAAPAMAHDHDALLEVNCTSLDRTELVLSFENFCQRTIEVEGKEYMAVDFHHKAGALVDLEGVGHPRIPHLCQSLLIPDTAKMELRVVDSNYFEIEDVDLISHKGNIIRNVNPSTVPYTFNEVYRTNAFYPGDLIHAREPFIMRDVRGMVVEIKPFQYNPVTKVLRVYDYMKVELVNVGSGSINVLDRANNKPKPSRPFESLYMNNFPNYGALTRSNPPTEDGDMLVISKGDYIAAMQPFVDWKNSIGINTTIVDVATIGNNSTSIGNYIENAYNTGNLAFVLLVGEANDVKPGSYSYYASDPNYTCITPDNYPDLFIGRFSAKNVGHVDSQVQRTIDYESEIHDQLAGDWNSRGLGVASNQGPGHHGEDDDEHCDLVRDELLAVGFTSVERSYDNFGTKTLIRNAWNNGVRIITYTGHGSTSGWGNGGGFNTGDAHQLTNIGMLPIVSSVACNVGEFPVNECFHEALQWSTHNGQPTGAVAGYGSTKSQSWNPPMDAQANHGINNQLGGVDRFWMQNNWTTGGCWFGGSCIMMDLNGSTGVTEFMCWTIFGDPSLRLYGQAAEQTLKTDSSVIPCTTGSTITFTVCPGQACANYGYIILGSISGATPGTPVPGGETLPLNWDYFTDMTVNWRNTSIFTDTYGVLDTNGEATATFNTQAFAPYDPRLAGTKFYFSALLWDGQPDLFDAVTNFRIVSFVDM